MPARANWKGVLKVGEVTCPVALYTAASTTERIAFHILNRKTGHRVHREFVDAETGERVEAKEQVKGYETGRRLHRYRARGDREGSARGRQDARNRGVCAVRPGGRRIF
jgi:hypothetical protein